MQDITELERRLSSALERIGHGVAGLGSAMDGPQDDGDTSSSAADLESERHAHRALEDSVRIERAEHEARVAAYEADLEKARTLIEAMEAERTRLRQVNEALRNSNQALRDANADGVSDAHLINAAALTELEALKVLREGDRAELEQILRALEPAIDERENENA